MQCNLLTCFGEMAVHPTLNHRLGSCNASPDNGPWSDPGATAPRLHLVLCARLAPGFAEHGQEMGPQMGPPADFEAEMGN